MTRKLELMKQIKAEYVDLSRTIGGSRLRGHYGAKCLLKITVNHNRWHLPITSKRAHRLPEDALVEVLEFTKVGKKIIKKAERVLFLEMKARNKAYDDAKALQVAK